MMNERLTDAEGCLAGTHKSTVQLTLESFQNKGA